MTDYLGQSILAQVTGVGHDPLNECSVSNDEIDRHVLTTLLEQGGHHSASSLSMGLDRSVSVRKVASRLRGLAKRGLVRNTKLYGQSDWELA